MKKTLFVAALVACAATAQAEDTVVGKLTAVQGVVTVSSDGSVAKGISGTPVTANSTIVVASGSKATMSFDTGCKISIGANQHLALNPNLNCKQQQASVSQLFTPYRVAQAPVGGAAVGGGGAVAGASALTSLAIAGGIVVVGAVALNEVAISGQ